jgi:NadR type nicotinamide-nucleotide adenylyltransferase
MAEKSPGMTKRIAITGPESTGKSWLAEHLAGWFNTRWVPEYAREYLQKSGRPYTREDILVIAKGQLRNEKKLASETDGLLFCDTEMLVTKIWGEVKFGQSEPWIARQFREHRYDLYLLCDIDLPWEYDPLREHPDHRQFLYDLYLKNLYNAGLPFHVIRGTGTARLDAAIQVINNFLNGK